MARVIALFVILCAATVAQAQPTQPTVIWDPSPNYNSRGGVTIDSIVIHTTEGAYSGAVSWLKNPSAGASAHYVIKEDGTEIRQLVADSDRAWHATYYNSRSIGIECAGFAGQAGTWTQGILPKLYDLVAWLCYTHGVNVVHPTGQATSQSQQDFNQAGLVGHFQVQPWNRSDPGAYFDWGALITEVNNRLGSSSSNDRVIDNTDPGFAALSGTWSTGTSAAGKYGADYRFAGTTSGGSATAVAEWRPNLPAGGDYEVSVYYPAGTNRSDNAAFSVTHANGTSSFAVNQQINGGSWVILGTFPFFTGSSGFVRLGNNCNASVVLADAVWFRSVTPAPPAPAPSGLVASAVNATDIQFSWNWSAYADGYFVDIAENASDLTTQTGTFQSVNAGRVNTYTWQGLTPGSTYYWRIWAFNAAGGNHGYPAPASLILPAGLPPTAPTNLVATVIGDFEIQFTWTMGTGQDGFWLDIAQSPSDLAAGAGAATFQNVQLGPTTASYNWTGLQDNTTYYWRVFAYNTIGGVHAYPATASVMTTGAGPGHTVGPGGGGSKNDSNGCVIGAGAGALPLIGLIAPLVLRRRKSIGKA